MEGESVTNFSSSIHVSKKMTQKYEIDLIDLVGKPSTLLLHLERMIKQCKEYIFMLDSKKLNKVTKFRDMFQGQTHIITNKFWTILQKIFILG